MRLPFSSRCATHERVVPARGRDLQRAFGVLLPLHVGEVLRVVVDDLAIRRSAAAGVSWCKSDSAATSVSSTLRLDLICRALPYALPRQWDCDRLERLGSACTHSGYQSFGTWSRRMAAA